MDEIRITKIQAAQRQIDAGILMLFRNDDPVAVHTVAMAGFRISRDLVEKKGLEHTMESMIRPGKEKEFWGSLNSFSNFCKHADRDPNDISSGFREDVNDSALLIAASYYESLGYPRTKEMWVLWAWYGALHPDVLSQEDRHAEMHALFLKSGGIRALPRPERLAIGLTALKKLPGNVFRNTSTGG